jgi:hypothetical protein
MGRDVRPVGSPAGQQLVLGWDAPTTGPGPETLTAELIDALAALLLEAAGPAHRPTTSGGRDESQDHR